MEVGDAEVDAEVARLLGALDPEQQRLIDVVGEGLARASDWTTAEVTFNYVEAKLDREGIDARSAIASLPRTSTLGTYSAIWTSDPDGMLSPETKLSLTMLGLWHCAGGFGDLANVFVDDGLAALRYLAAKRRAYEPEPWSTGGPEATSAQVVEAISGNRPPGGRAARLQRTLEHELVQMSNRSGGPADWRWEIPRQVLRFEDVTDFEEYLRRTLRMYWHSRPVLERTVSSPLSLVAELDYLDMVWRVLYGRRLVQLRGAETTARLAFGAGTADEFSSRLSGLADTLKGLQVEPPGMSKKHPLDHLRIHLKQLRGDEAAERVSGAFQNLQDISTIRNWHQHGATQADVVHAFERLGIAFPVWDFAAAWSTVQARAVESLEAVREELQAAIA